MNLPSLQIAPGPPSGYLCRADGAIRPGRCRGACNPFTPPKLVSQPQVASKLTHNDWYKNIGLVIPVRSGPGQSQRQASRQILPPPHPARVEENQAGLAGAELHHGSGCLNPLALDARDPSGFGTSRISQLRPLPAARLGSDGPARERVSSGVPEPLETALGATYGGLCPQVPVACGSQ